MKLKDLPLKLMHTEISNPIQENLNFLDSLYISEYIARKYESLEDRANAFDGAFTGVHIHNHLSRRGDKEIWLIEILGWYDHYEQKDLKSPFYDGLKTVLNACGLKEFFKEAIDYVIEKKGILDRYRLF
jgi:hypothetical protein